MFLTDIILRLRSTCPLFEERVAGTQSFVAATKEDVDIGVPCAFVVPMSDTAKGREYDGAAQMITERFATIICADNSKDARNGRGLSAETVLKIGRQQIANALMNWAPLSMPNASGVAYARSQHLFMNNARIWHQYEWTIDYFLNPNADAPEDAGYTAIERIIQGNFPEVDAVRVRKIMTNTANMQRPINPADPDSYDVVFQAMSDTNPEWIKFRDTTNDDRRPVAESPGNVVFHGHRKVDPS